MSKEEQKNASKYSCFCFACGSALYQHEIAAQITGQTVDFDERIAIQNTNYFFCRECLLKSKDYLQQGMSKAVERREEQKSRLQEIDLSDIPRPGV